jgi:hypothetical protein
LAEDPTGPSASGQPGPLSDDTSPEEWAALPPEERAVLLKVADILKRIQFGTVVLVIQDGKVVQIEMAEKFRLR